MHIEHTKNSTNITGVKEVSSFSEFVEYVVDIYSSAHINPDYWLTRREKDFFISTIICLMNDIDDPISEEGVKLYQEYFSPKATPASIGDYINRCRNKYWIKYDKRKRLIEVPDLFIKIVNGATNISFDLNFTLNVK